MKSREKRWAHSPHTVMPSSRNDASACREHTGAQHTRQGPVPVFRSSLRTLLPSKGSFLLPPGPPPSSALRQAVQRFRSTVAPAAILSANSTSRLSLLIPSMAS